jgi:glycosyltransferase involved in cell wall biosynthesis
MKISFVEPHLELFGGIRRILELSNRLVNLGEDVTVYHPAGTPCSWMPCKAKVKALGKVFEQEHDVILFNDPPDYKIVKRARAKLKVFYILGLYDRERLKHFSLKILWPKKGRVISIKRILQLPFLKITNATWMQRYLKEQLRIETEVVLGGINREVFYPVKVNKAPGCVRILCTGDPREYKGTETVREAVEILREEYPHAVMDTYFGKNIPQSRMAEKYCSADVFVDAQWNTGCGWNNPVAEAMACKVPVVCTDIGGVGDFALHEQTALLVKEKNPNELAAGMKRLMKNDSLRSALVLAAYERICKFDWDENAERLLSILRAHLPK